MEPTTTTTAALDAALEPRRYLVAIGIDEYDDPDIPDLKLAEADANAMADRLGAHGRYDEIVALTRPELTDRASVFGTLKEVTDPLRREDTLVVYFSGHGTRVPDDDTWRRFLMTTDTDPGDLEGSAIELTSFQHWFSRLRPTKKALIIDACFNGDGRSVVRPVAASPVAPNAGNLVPAAASLAAGEAHMMATTPGRPARESDALGHGVYTFHLLDALSWGLEEADKDDDGVVTAFEAHDHARGAVIAYTEGVQIPEAVFRIVGTDDVVLGGDPKKRRKRADALIYQYSGSESVPGESRVVVDGRDRGLLPGSVMVPAGRQQVEIVSEDGARVSTGRIRLKPGKTYRADHLARSLGGPSRQFFVHGSALAVPIAIGESSGLFAGGELGARFRLSQKQPRGLYLDLRAGGGLSDPLEASRHSAGWLGMGSGWQRDLGFLRLALGADSAVTLIPGSIQPEHPVPRGWWFWGIGPAGRIGVALGEDWAVVGQARGLIGGLDGDADGTVTVTIEPSLAAGLELSF